MTDGSMYIGRNLNTSHSTGSATQDNSPKSYNASKLAVKVARAVETPLQVLGALALAVGVIGAAFSGIGHGWDLTTMGLLSTAGVGAVAIGSSLLINELANKLLSRMGKDKNLSKEDGDFIGLHKHPSQDDLSDFRSPTPSRPSSSMSANSSFDSPAPEPTEAQQRQKDIDEARANGY